MRNKTIQSNMPFIVPNDEVANMEFASGETPPNTLHNVMHYDPNEELSDEVMFDDEGASIATPFPSNPSSSRPNFDFGLSSSSSESVDE